MTDIDSSGDEQAVARLSALAQTTRFAVFRLLMGTGPMGMAAGDIAIALDVPQNSLSSHLKILVQADLLVCTRQGRSLIYAVDIDNIRDLIGHLVNDCCSGHPEICAITTLGAISGSGC